MKKKLRLFAVLLAGILLAFSLVACGEDPQPAEPPTSSVPPTTLPPAFSPESAMDLWEKINETMNGLNSVEMTISTNQISYSKGYEYVHNSTRYVLSTHDVHYTLSKSELICEALLFSQTVDLMEAYYDGKMYRAVKDGVYDQKFCSELSHDDYDRLHTGGLTDELGIPDCTDATFSQDADGRWQLRFQGYTKKAIDQAMQTLGLTEQGIGAAITDMTVELSANAAFYVEEMRISFAFSDVGHSQPEFTVKTIYSNWNSAAFDPALLDTQAYKQVEDIQVLDAVTAALQARRTAQIGQFTLQTGIIEEYDGETRSAQEEGTMIYGWSNGAFQYSFTALMDGENYQVQYRNGEQTVISGGKSYTVAKSEAEAKAYIDGLIDSANYNSFAITSIEKREDGAYILTSENPDVSDFTAEMEEVTATQQIVVYFQDGKLTQISSCLVVEGIFERDFIKITKESSLTFTDLDAFPEA